MENEKSNNESEREAKINNDGDTFIILILFKCHGQLYVIFPVLSTVGLIPKQVREEMRINLHFGTVARMMPPYIFVFPDNCAVCFDAVVSIIFLIFREFPSKSMLSVTPNYAFVYEGVEMSQDYTYIYPFTSYWETLF